MKNEKELHSESCKKQLLAIYDTIDVLSGKWKIAIMAVLIYYENRRFSDILNDVGRISNKMLSKELKDLEMNHLVKRTVLNTQPVSVKYELTEYGRSLAPVIKILSDWGLEYRKKIFFDHNDTNDMNI